MNTGRVMALVLAVALAGSGSGQAADGPSPEDSLVFVMATSQRYKFTQPWEKEAPRRKRGLGVLLENGKVLVTAELTADAAFIEFERPSTGDRITAKVVARDYESNLALLAPDNGGTFFAGMVPVPVDGPVKPGTATEVWQMEENGTPVVTKGTVARAETGPYFLPDRSFLRYEWKGSLQNKAGSFIVPCMREGKLAGILLGYNSDDQLADVLPSPVIARFLDDLADGEYRGFPVLGIRYAPTTDVALRKWLGLPDDLGGIYVSRIEKGSAADAGGLRVGDVILALGGHPLDRRGSYSDPAFGTLNFGHIINGMHAVGDTIEARLWRAGKEINLTFTLGRKEASSYLVDPWFFDKAPPYVMRGGLLFVELTRPYLQSFRDWEKNAPLELRYAEANQDEFAGGRRKLVILAYMIPTPANIGYERITSQIVEEVNGRKIADMAGLKDAFDHPADGRHMIKLDGDLPVLHLDAGVTRAVDAEMKMRGIPSLDRLP